MQGPPHPQQPLRRPVLAPGRLSASCSEPLQPLWFLGTMNHLVSVQGFGLINKRGEKNMEELWKTDTGIGHPRNAKTSAKLLIGRISFGDL